MGIAVIAWALGFSLTATALSIFWQNARVAGVAVCMILMVQIYVRPLMFFAGVDSPAPYGWFDDNPWGLMATSLMVAGAWVSVLTVTYLAVWRILPQRGLLPQAPTESNMTLIKWAAISVTVLNILFTSLLILQYGGIAPFVFAVKIGKQLNGSYVFREIGTLAVAISAYGLLCSARPAGPDHRSKRGTQLMIVLILMNFTVNYMWGNRYNLAILSLALGVAYHYYVRKFTVLEIVSYILVLGGTLEGLKIIRNALVSEVVGRDISSDLNFWYQISASLHFNQMDAYMLALRDAGDKFDFRNGQDFVNGLLSWVPRSILPNKETFQIGGWFRRVYEPLKVNGWPITIIGDWYVNFGAFGIVFGGILSGLVTAIIDAAYRDVRNNPWAAAAGASIAFTMLDGGLDFGFPQRIVLLLIPLWLFTVYLRVFSQKRVAAA